MPEPFDFDEARRALDDVRAPDLWPEAERRAAGVGVVPLVADAGRGHRRGRWLAAAAVLVLAAGTVAVLTDGDDDGQVDTAPEATTPSTIIDSGGCRFGIAPPSAFVSGPPDPPIFDDGGQSDGQTVVHKDLGGQVLEIRVPGLVVTDLVGERVEQVELERGTADVWFGDGFVQVRWFTGSQEPCGSFTVTVSGSTEDGNRHAAVDWAERISVPGELEPAPSDTRPTGGSIGDPSQGFAIWPETAPEDVPDLDVERRSGRSVAEEFAREVLGWADARVVDGQSEPSEDGREHGEVHEVTSTALGTTVVVRVAPARPEPGPYPFVYVVYQVDTPDRLGDPDATASVQVLDGVATGGAGSPPAGTVRTRVRFAYRDHVVEGTPTDHLRVRSDAGPGSILVIWEGADGVLGAWGTTLPQGDFAAG